MTKSGPAYCRNPIFGLLRYLPHNTATGMVFLGIRNCLDSHSTVSEWHPLPNGQGKRDSSACLHDDRDVLDVPLVMRFKGPGTLDALDIRTGCSPASMSGPTRDYTDKEELL